MDKSIIMALQLEQISRFLKEPNTISFNNESQGLLTFSCKKKKKKKKKNISSDQVGQYICGIPCVK